MSIDFACPHCSSMLRVARDDIGKHARCPRCQTVSVVEPQIRNELTESFADSPSGQPGMATQKSAFHFQDTPLVLPHRGGMVLTLGLVGMVLQMLLILMGLLTPMCLPCASPVIVPGVIAWFCGRNDLRKMDRQQMDSTGRSVTQAGMILGLIATGISILCMLAIVAFIVLIVVFSFSLQAVP